MTSSPRRGRQCANGALSTLARRRFGAHAPVVMAKNRLVMTQRVGGDAQRKCSAVLHVAGVHGQYLAAADAVIGAQAQPGSKRSGAAKLGGDIAMRRGSDAE